MAESRSQSILIRGVGRVGKSSLGLFTLIGGTTRLTGTVGRWYWKSGTGGSLRVGWPAVIAQMVRVGVRSIGIVLLVSACIGLILAIAMYPPLSELGQQNKIANIVGIAIFREMGPIISAVVLTGFAGASIAAEIGTMVVGEEIEALEAHALDPVRFLVLPRLTATAISLLLLTVLADVAAVVCSGFVTVVFFDVGAQVYIDNTLAQLEMADFLTGLIKAITFGLMLGAIACFNGLRVSGGAAGVGKATTDTVVQTIVAVIVSDLVYDAIFLELGWT
ncbi:MAG: ABC transporter permease [Planctomycetes bacterium]|jgi:phospholipid/cholesterol/gamma-HCH transport system permease protein|nr:ABC transporter permease [Planctomycetota bacterium]MCP4839563.1 ABC transporter permease [Planctomycetota bacterium]